MAADVAGDQASVDSIVERELLHVRRLDNDSASLLSKMLQVSPSDRLTLAQTIQEINTLSG